jgi:hypothetical protein
MLDLIQATSVSAAIAAYFHAFGLLSIALMS